MRKIRQKTSWSGRADLGRVGSGRFITDIDYLVKYIFFRSISHTKKKLKRFRDIVLLESPYMTLERSSRQYVGSPAIFVPFFVAHIYLWTRSEFHLFVSHTVYASRCTNFPQTSFFVAELSSPRASLYFPRIQVKYFWLYTWKCILKFIVSSSTAWYIRLYKIWKYNLRKINLFYPMNIIAYFFHFHSKTFGSINNTTHN